jgi:hypothetical protein
MPAEMFKVIATFVNAAGEPLTGDEYRVLLRDRDRFFDDKLGASKLDTSGTAEFLIFTVDILSFDSVGERTPDLYFIVERNGREVHRTRVFDDVDFDIDDPVTGRPKSLTRTFGPFSVSEP